MAKNLITILITMWYLLCANTTFAYTHADTLRGSNGRGRDWWDVKYYNLLVEFDTAAKSITGQNTISLSVTKKPIDSMQIDLQEPMQIDSVELTVHSDDTDIRQLVTFKKDGNVWWLTWHFSEWKQGATKDILIYYHGKPRAAVNAPWDGGFTWAKDTAGNPWIAVSCQGLGASVWWPCKDAQWDEPDNGMSVAFTVPRGLKAVSNGKLLLVSDNDDRQTYSWGIVNPINNYDVTFYIGDYVHWQDTLMGEKGQLNLNFWVLSYNEERAKKQFEVVKPMLHCFEYWMGPYPFYEDGYKLVDAPYLGMEHQGAVAYGNGYKMGYMGFDRSFTGIGMDFDYIIVHESGHEWFGNNITAKDIADNWVHEGITTYSESLFEECMAGKEKGQKFCRGEWMNIRNDKPIIGKYGINEEGSDDMYDKGAAIMYMIRFMTNDDEKFRLMLRGLGKDNYHQTVTTQTIEGQISWHTGLDLTAFFDQYLRTKNIPQLEYTIKNNELNYKFNNIVTGFTLPITVTGDDGTAATIKPIAEWQHIPWAAKGDIKVSKDFLIKVKK